MSDEIELYKRRLKRERSARKQAESLLEKKSRQLYEANLELKEAADYQKDVLQPEDIGLCESVQRGLYSKGYNQGRFIVDKGKTELSEHAVHHFQTMVMEALGFDLK